MLNRDFTKSKKDYVFNNKFYLITALIIFLVGVVMLSVFGLNRSIDYTGGYMVTVNIEKEISDKKLESYDDKINNILSNNNLELYSVQLKGEGVNTCLEIKYTGKLTDKKIDSINAGIVTEIKVNSTNISEHEKLDKIIGVTDYIYLAVAILLILVISTLFTMFRHNIAYAISLMAGGVFAVLGLVFATAILRIKIEEAYLPVILLTLIYALYEIITLFENMREVKSRADDKKNLSKHLVEGMKKSTSRIQFSSVALFVMGLILVFFGTGATRSTAISIMFGVLMSLVATVFVVPFVYNLTVDMVKYTKIDKKQKTESKKVEDENAFNSNQAKLVESKVVETSSEDTENNSVNDKEIEVKDDQNTETDSQENKNETESENESLNKTENVTEGSISDETDKA